MKLEYIKIIVFAIFAYLVSTKGIEFLMNSKSFSYPLTFLFWVFSIKIYYESYSLINILDMKFPRDKLLYGVIKLHLLAIATLCIGNLLYILLDSLNGLVVMVQVAFAFILSIKISKYLKEQKCLIGEKYD